MFPSPIALLAFTSLLARAEVHIVDDQDGAPGFTTTGDDWASWGMSGYGFDGGDSSYHYLSHTVGGDDRRGTATWQAELGQAGTWRIETWFRRTENRTTDADHGITDGLGSRHWVVLDQTGEGASGWVSLGEYWCDAGFGGCSVTLDGTDDDQSDEANAVRFTLVSADEGPPETDPCEGEAEPGSHTLDFYAGSASGSDWESASLAVGPADGQEAHSPNVDSGEILRASGFGVCDPPGDQSIDRVLLAVKARTQYDSGTYALELQLDADGAASTVFTGTTARWHELDISGDQAWSWAALAGLAAQVSLHDHPGGARDSDAWVDAFRLRVAFTTAGEEEPPEEDSGGEDEPPDDDDPGTVDSAAPSVDDSGRPWPGPGEAVEAEPSAGCRTPGVGALAWLGGAAWFLLIPLRGRRRERPRPR